jgi:hypothetical protein
MRSTAPVWLAATVIACVTIFAVSPGSASAGPRCVPVAATATGAGLGDQQAEVYVGTTEIGRTTGTYTYRRSLPPIMTLSGQIKFMDRFGVGTLTGYFAGFMDVSTGSFQTEGDVVGDGVFTGVTGHLVFNGTQDPTHRYISVHRDNHR